MFTILWTVSLICEFTHSGLRIHSHDSLLNVARLSLLAVKVKAFLVIVCYGLAKFKLVYIYLWEVEVFNCIRIFLMLWWVCGLCDTLMCFEHIGRHTTDNECNKCKCTTYTSLLVGECTLANRHISTRIFFDIICIEQIRVDQLIAK